MKNLLDVDDDGELTGAELQGYPTERRLKRKWKNFRFEPTDDQFVDLTFDDFDFAVGSENCIILSEYQDAMETDSVFSDFIYSGIAGDDDCVTKQEWRDFVLKFKYDEPGYSRADFFDRVYGGNCDYWLSDDAAE